MNGEIVFDKSLGLLRRLVYLIPAVAAILLVLAVACSMAWQNVVIPAWWVLAVGGSAILAAAMPIRLRVCLAANKDSRTVTRHVMIGPARIRKRSFDLARIELARGVINVILDETNVCSASIVFGPGEAPLIAPWERWFFGIPDREMLAIHRCLLSRTAPRAGSHRCQ